MNVSSQTDKLPIVLSVPHAGLGIPPEVSDIVLLSREEIIADGDEEAGVIYDLNDMAAAFCRADVARAFVDMNRRPDDFSRDGVVKTATCQGNKIYGIPLSASRTRTLLDRYYFPYHDRLDSLASRPGIVLGLDCHTMLPVGPEPGPDTGRERPDICLSNAGCDKALPWLEKFADAFGEAFAGEVKINDPFHGGHITRRRPGGIPWIQVEFKRGGFFSAEEKKDIVVKALFSVFRCG